MSESIKYVSENKDRPKRQTCCSVSIDIKHQRLQGAQIGMRLSAQPKAAGEKEKKSAKQSELQGDSTEEWILNNPVIDYIRVGPRVWMALFARSIND